jgi:hypothetical protein
MEHGIAILVRYAGPTNFRGSRWIARADHPEGRAVVGYDHALGTGIENAKTAADALVARWNARIVKDDAERYGDSGQASWLWSLRAGGHTVDGYAFIAAYAR